MGGDNSSAVIVKIQRVWNVAPRAPGPQLRAQRAPSFSRAAYGQAVASSPPVSARNGPSYHFRCVLFPARIWSRLHEEERKPRGRTEPRALLTPSVFRTGCGTRSESPGHGVGCVCCGRGSGRGLRSELLAAVSWFLRSCPASQDDSLEPRSLGMTLL